MNLYAIKMIKYFFDIKKDGQFRLLSVFIFFAYAHFSDGGIRPYPTYKGTNTDLIPMFKRQRFTLY